MLTDFGDVFASVTLIIFLIVYLGGLGFTFYRIGKLVDIGKFERLFYFIMVASIPVLGIFMYFVSVEPTVRAKARKRS